MANIIREEDLVEQARQLRHTFVQGRDGRHFRVITFKLYEFEVPQEFHRFETNVQECDDRAKYQVLVQPLLKRFYREDHALKFHEQLLEHFDRVLKIPEPKTEEKK